MVGQTTLERKPDKYPGDKFWNSGSCSAWGVNE